MALTIPTLSGATLGTWLADGEAIVNAPLEAFLPADAMALVQLGEKLLNVFAKLVTQPSAATELQAEVDAEQTAFAAAEKAKFPNG
jgi:hypothetical protein